MRSGVPAASHRQLGTALAALLVGAAALLAGSARAEKGLTDGIYRDAAGGQHSWNIERGHMLTWDEKPYTPSGVVFHSAYLNSPSRDTLDKDSAELDRLKAAGVQDLWIDPQRGLMENGVTETQTLIDAVESRGFHYGLKVGDRYRKPLIGFSPTVASVTVPVAKLQPNTRLTFDVPAPQGRKALYTLVELGAKDTEQSWSIASGEVMVEGDKAHIEIQTKNSKLLGHNRGMLHVVPEIQVEPDDLGSFGDLWDGMEGYSSRVKKYLQSLKFGGNLRFIIDVFSAGDGSMGQEDNVFPSSTAFRTAFQDWLGRRFGVITLNQRWRTDEKRIPGMEEAARLIPMWPRNDPPEGDGWLYDPVDGETYRCTPRDSSIWSDLEAFRTDTLKRWMNRITGTLKQEGLNVPMLFTWSAYHPIFTNSPSPSGYDGLGANLYGEPATLAKESAAYALAQAEEADRNTWLVATRMAGPQDSDGKPAPLGDSTQASSLWAAARDAGFRGVFFDPEQVPNAVSLATALAATLASDVPVMKAKPRVCFFPMTLVGSERLTRLPNGVWWLPSGAPARLIRYGDNIMAYEIDNPLGDDSPVRRGAVFWSVAGRQDATFAVDKLQSVTLFDSAGEPVKAKTKKGEMRVTLSEEPLVAMGLDTQAIFPLEMTVTQLRDMDELLRQAEMRHLDTSAYRKIYEDARGRITPASASTIYASLSPYLAQLREQLAPYQWIEGERAISNFGATAFQPGTSGGTYLKLDRTKPPVSGYYRAVYHVAIREAASYEIWVAGRVPGRPGVSPMLWQIDEDPGVEVAKPMPAGADYAAGMAWYQVGRVTLTPGRHDLRFVVADRAEGKDGHYAAGIDAVVLSREPFKPQGTQKPALRSIAPPPPPAEKSQKGDKPAKPSLPEKRETTSAPADSGK